MSTTEAEAVEYDSEGDIVYMHLADPEVPVDWTQPLDDTRLIDYSADGRVLGVEFLDALVGGMDLRDVPLRPKIEELIGNSGLGIKILIQ
jgi:uncharacterized protein YuzE